MFCDWIGVLVYEGWYIIGIMNLVKILWMGSYYKGVEYIIVVFLYGYILKLFFKYLFVYLKVSVWFLVWGREVWVIVYCYFVSFREYYREGG